MTSYHRVLKLFQRSVDDHSISCNCDIHPWQMTINGERWTGKIRLIGFIDVFFLISYSGKSTFQRGIVIYKDENDIKTMLESAGIDPENFRQSAEDDADKAAPKTFFKFWRDSMDYKVKSVGLEVGLQTRFTPSSVKQYEVIVRKPDESISKGHIKKAFKQHDSLDLIEDAILIGYISYADLLGAGIGKVVEGTPAAMILKNFNSSMQSAQTGAAGGLSGGNL